MLPFDIGRVLQLRSNGAVVLANKLHADPTWTLSCSDRRATCRTYIGSDDVFCGNYPAVAIAWLDTPVNPDGYR